MDVVITEVPELKRFEARSPDGDIAGFAEYLTTDQLVVLTHTEVDPAYEGQGIGSQLARGTLDAIRKDGRAVLPLCPFIKGWIGRNPDYNDLVYSAPPSNATD